MMCWIFDFLAFLAGTSLGPTAAADVTAPDVIGPEPRAAVVMTPEPGTVPDAHDASARLATSAATASRNEAVGITSAFSITLDSRSSWHSACCTF